MRNHRNFLQCSPLLLLFVVAFIMLCTSKYIVRVDSSRLLNASFVDQSFSPAVATWYGSPTGAGSGGACGFENDVEKFPFNGFTSAGNQNLFKSGHGCGSCYRVKCTNKPECSGKSITVTITNECPGSCNDDGIHFDLSGKAFGLLAKAGQDSILRNYGRIDVLYKRVSCRYQQRVTFRIDEGSNPYYIAFAVEFINGDGEIGSMELLPPASNSSVGAIEMQQSWGGMWKAGIPDGVKGPFSVRLTTLERKRTLFAPNVIPADYWAHKGTQINEATTDDDDGGSSGDDPITVELQFE